MGTESDPDRRTRVHDLSLDHEGLMQAVGEGATEVAGRRFTVHDTSTREFVAPEPSHDVRRSHLCPQDLCHLNEQLVAGRMAERIVDELEPVHVDQRHRDLVARLEFCASRLHGIGERQTIQQSGQ